MSSSTTTREKVKTIDLAAIISLIRNDIQTLGLKALENTIVDCTKSGSMQKKQYSIGTNREDINIIDVIEAFRQSNEGSNAILVTKPLDEKTLKETLREWCGIRGWFLGMNLTLIIPFCASKKLEVLVKVKQIINTSDGTKISRIISHTDVPRDKQKERYIQTVKKAFSDADDDVKESTNLFKGSKILWEEQSETSSATLMLFETFLNNGDIQKNKEPLVNNYFNAIISHELNQEEEQLLQCEVSGCCNKWSKVPAMIAKHYESKRYYCTDIGRKCCKLPREVEANTHDDSEMQYTNPESPVSKRNDSEPDPKRQKLNDENNEVVLFNPYTNVVPEELQMKEREFETENPKPSSRKHWFEGLPQGHVFSISIEDLPSTEENKRGLKTLFSVLYSPTTERKRVMVDKLNKDWGKKAKTTKLLQYLFHPDKNPQNPVAKYFSQKINALEEASEEDMKNQGKAYHKAKKEISRKDIEWEKKRKAFIKAYLIQTGRSAHDVDLTGGDDDAEYIDLVSSSDDDSSDDEDDDNSHVPQGSGTNEGELVARASNEEEEFNFMPLGYRQGPATDRDFVDYCPSCLTKHKLGINFNDPTNSSVDTKKIGTHASQNECHPYTGFQYKKDKSARNFTMLKCFVLASRVKKVWLKLSDANNMTTLTTWTEIFFNMDSHISKTLSNAKKEKIELSGAEKERLKQSLESNRNLKSNEGWTPGHLAPLIKQDFQTLKNNLLNLYNTDAFKTKWINEKPKAVFVNDMNAALSSIYHLENSPNVMDLVATGSFPSKWL